MFISTEYFWQMIIMKPRSKAIIKILYLGLNLVIPVSCKKTPNNLDIYLPNPERLFRQFYFFLKWSALELMSMAELWYPQQRNYLSVGVVVFFSVSCFSGQLHAHTEPCKQIFKYKLRLMECYFLSCVWRRRQHNWLLPINIVKNDRWK